MTDLLVGQVGAEVLYRVIPSASVSQVGVEYMHRVQPGVRVSQVGLEYMHRVQPTFAVTQAGVEILYKQVPCTTRLAQVWTIERTDGEVFRFTSLDRDFEYRGDSYQSCDSLAPSASQSVSEVDAAGNMDLTGALASEAISSWDLYGGLFDGATVEAWLVPWDGVGVRKRLLKGTFGAVELGEHGFNVALIGDGAKLMQTPLVSLLQPGCRWQFGDRFCQKDLAPLTVTGAVDTGIGQREFTDAARAETPGYFGRGRVTFTTGANAGVSAEIKSHEAGGVFGLWPRLPFAIAAGDEYSMTPGCTNLKDASGGTNGCSAWANLSRYGGFKKVPGGDKRSAAANVR